MTLTAMLPVLYRSTQYEPGDTLPADDAALVEAWLEAGSAKWLQDIDEAQPAQKAKLAMAEPGKPGLSSDGDPEALVGKPASRKRRSGK